MAACFVFSDNNRIAAELLCLAKAAGHTTVLLTTSHSDAQELAYNGADNMLILEGGSPAVENNAREIARLLQERGAEVLLVGATPRGRDFAARVAGYLDSAMASDASSVEFTEKGVLVERTLYGGMVEQSEMLVDTCVITLGEGLAEASVVSTKSGSEVIELVDDLRVRIIETVEKAAGAIDLVSADIVVGAGLGLEKEADLEMVRELASKLGAGVGCTRGISEDRGWLPVECYLGISGQVIKPSLYIALAMSGQIQHIYGVKDSKIIVGINKDPNARIFKVCDYGIVGDINEIVPLMIQSCETVRS